MYVLIIIICYCYYYLGFHPWYSHLLSLENDLSNNQEHYKSAVAIFPLVTGPPVVETAHS